MDTRDAVASALAVAGVAGVAVATALLTGSAWWGLLVIGASLLLAGVMVSVTGPDEVVVPSESEDTVRTMRTSAPSLGVEIEESHQGTTPKIGHAIGQPPEFYYARNAP